MADAKWRIRMSAFNKLWFDAYPRIVGHMWHLEYLHPEAEIQYTKAFKTNEAFRREQFAKLGVQFDTEFGDMPIYFDEVSADDHHREIDIIIGERGLILPDPIKPATENHVFNMYQLRPPSQQGWRLPNMNLKLYGDNPQHRTGQGVFLKLDEARKAAQRPNPAEKLDPGCEWSWCIRGNVYRDLLLAYPKIVAYAWEDYRFFLQLYGNGNNGEAVIRALQASDIHFPPGLKITTDPNRKDDDGWISDKGFHLPFPEKPDMRDLYSAWEQGGAGIPTFTNSKT